MVTLSLELATVSQLVSQLGQVPEVRQEQVNSLRAETAAGKYNPSNWELAKAIASQLFRRSE